MLESLVHDAGKVGADYLLAAGDISAEAVPVDLSKALQLLKKFGKYRRDYFVARGNHDRAHDGDAYAACSVGQWQGQRLFPRPVLPGRRADLLHPRAPGPAGRGDRPVPQAPPGKRRPGTPARTP